MFSLKKTVTAVLALGGSAVFAGGMGPVCSPGNITIPCERSGWEVGAAALYLQSDFNNGWSYIGGTSARSFAASGLLAARAGPSTPGGLARPTNTTTTYSNFNPSWNWGFEVDASYYFNTGNDINVSWYHLNTGNSLFGPFFTNGTGNIITPNQNPGALLKANTTVTNTIETTYISNLKWDAVNAELGQYVDFSANKRIRFHGGAQYAEIKASVSTYGSNASSLDGVFGVPMATPVSTTGNFNSRYSGFGPRAGMDMNYDFANGFGIYGKLAAAVLVGTSKFNNSRSGSNGLSSMSSGSKNAIVPELEAKLGGSYTYAFSHGSLTLDAGYLWFNYFNVLDTDAMPLSQGTIAETDYSSSGPYVGLTYVS